MFLRKGGHGACQESLRVGRAAIFGLMLGPWGCKKWLRTLVRNDFLILWGD